MVERLKIQGNSPEEKFASIEATLQGIRRRIASRATIYIPPIPIILSSRFNEGESIIGRTIFPFSGTLKDLFVNVETMTTRTAILVLEIITDVAKTQTKITLTRKSQRFPLELKVDGGTLFQIILEEGKIIDPIIATAIYPVVEDHKAKQFLLEELEKEDG